MSVDADMQPDAAVSGCGPSDVDPSVQRRSLGGDNRFADCLSRLNEVVTELGEVDLSALSEERLTAGAADLAKAVSRLGAVRGRMLVAIEKNESWRASGARTFVLWSEKTSGQSPSAAVKEIKRAEALDSGLRRMSEALKNGEVFAGHVDVVRRFLSAPELEDAFTDAVEEEFVAWARECAPREFERRVKARAYRHSPSFGVETEKAEAKKENVAFAKEGSGMRISGWLSDESSAIVDTALSAFMGRKRVEDARSLPQRRAGALVELAGAKLDEGGLGKGARIRPHILVHVPFETLRGLENGTPRPGTEDVQGRSVAGDDGVGEERDGSPSKEGTRLSKARTDRSRGSSDQPERRDGVGCLGEACREAGRGQGRFGACLESSVSQQEEFGTILGAIPALTDVDALRGNDPAVLDDGSPLSATQLARLVCDSSVSRLIFSANGEVLDVGREKRLFTPAQTRAVIARDRTCRYPGCGDTISHGQVHHALPWEAGGKTDLANAVLLCWRHHALVHREKIAIAHHSGGFVFTSPDGKTMGTRKHGT